MSVANEAFSTMHSARLTNNRRTSWVRDMYAVGPKDANAVGLEAAVIRMLSGNGFDRPAMRWRREECLDPSLHPSLFKQGGKTT